jgi:muramoyltetrapeptide carboxypeptidase
VLVAPPRVRPGNTVAVVCPSAPAVGWWPHRVERGVAYLEGLGLSVRVMPHARKVTGWTAGSGRERADDLNAAFADPDVAVVLCALGGNHSNQVVDHVDFSLVAEHPKVFQGLSDITVLHWALQRHAGLRTFYGPALTTSLAEHPAVLDLTDRSLRAAWFGSEAPVYEPAEAWTDELLDFFTKADLERPRALVAGTGWRWLRPGRAAGRFQGGCLETICWHLTGSTEWLDLEGAVLLLETSEQRPSPAEVDAYLTDLARLGVLDAVVGVVVARPYGYAEGDELELLWRVVTEATAPSGVPVLAGIDAGHTDPMLTLPLGADVELDAATGTFRALEPVTDLRP